LYKLINILFSKCQTLEGEGVDEDEFDSGIPYCLV